MTANHRHDVLSTLAHVGQGRSLIACRKAFFPEQFASFAVVSPHEPVDSGTDERHAAGGCHARCITRCTDFEAHPGGDPPRSTVIACAERAAPDDIASAQVDTGNKAPGWRNARLVKG